MHFMGSGAHVIAISESCLKSHIPSKNVKIDGYNLVRNDRRGCRGGGVAIYICDHF